MNRFVTVANPEPVAGAGFPFLDFFFAAPCFFLWVTSSRSPSSLSSLDSDSDSFLRATLARFFAFGVAVGDLFLCVRWCAALSFFVTCVSLQPWCGHAKRGGGAPTSDSAGLPHFFMWLVSACLWLVTNLQPGAEQDNWVVAFG